MRSEKTSGEDEETAKKAGRDWVREVPRETTCGQEKGFPPPLFFIPTETNNIKDITTFLSVFKVDKRKWLRNVFS